jgi:hypothetical protein
MKTLLIASAAFAALIVTSVAADARGFRGGGGGFHGVRAGGYRGAVAGGYRGGYGRYGYGRYGRYGYGYRPGVGLAAAGVGAAAAAGYYGTRGGCGPYAYYDSYAGVCRSY